MIFEKIFKKPYQNGWKDLPNKTTPIRAKIMDAYDAAIDTIDTRVVELAQALSEEVSKTKDYISKDIETEADMRDSIEAVEVKTADIISEIDDARVDPDGNTYDSLGDIIRQAFMSGGGGGGGGTTNYNNLNNLPTINGVTVKGNLTLEDLGITAYIEELILGGAS